MDNLLRHIQNYSEKGAIKLYDPYHDGFIDPLFTESNFSTKFSYFSIPPALMTLKLVSLSVYNFKYILLQILLLNLFI